MAYRIPLSIAVSLASILSPLPVLAACNIIGGQGYGDCAGVTINRGKEPFREITTLGSISGLSEGARVMSGGSLSVTGSADRIIVEEGGRATINGMVTTLIVSGSAQIEGVVSSLTLKGGTADVNGVLHSYSGVGVLNLAAGSVVMGVPTEVDRTVTVRGLP